MRPIRLAKAVARGLRVTWRDEPTQHDIAALDANTRRVGLVIRLRWVLVLVLALFSVTATAVYTTAIPLEELASNLVIPGVALVFVLAYNTFYQATYRQLGNLAILNHAQLMFDVLVVAVLIHYSGGVYSWFHAMFLLFILEGAFILPRSRDVWMLTAFACLVYAGIVLGQYVGWLPLVPVPFVLNDLPGNITYVLVRLLWVFTIMAGTASISSYLMSEVRGREARLASAVILDEATGLCNRHYFNRILNSEIQRARRIGGSVGVVMLDVDDFTRFNDTFGYRGGNRMLEAVAEELAATVAEGADADADLVTLCRYGGEEFALVVPGEPPADSEDGHFAARISRMAERLRVRIQALRVADRGVTISVGLAIFPADADSADDLLTAVDQAVATACESGGDRVVAASETPA